MAAHELSFHQRVAIDAILARQRSDSVGLATVQLPERPTYSNDEATEDQRSIEYEALAVCCAAQATAWNAEAHRWHAERAQIVAELTRVVANELAQSVGLAQPGETASARMLPDGEEDEEDYQADAYESVGGACSALAGSVDSAQGSSRAAAHGARRLASLGAADVFFTADSGLAAHSVPALKTECDLYARRSLKTVG